MGFTSDNGVIMSIRLHAHGNCVGDETWSFGIVFTEIVRAMARNGYDLSVQHGTEEFKRHIKPIPDCKKEKGWAFTCRHPDHLNLMPMAKRSFYCYWGEHLLRPDHVKKMNTLDRVFVNSQFSKNLLQASGVIVPVSIMHPGMNPAIHFPSTRVYGKDVVKFLFVGQQWRRKGLDSLAAVWKNFSNQNHMALTIKLAPSNPGDLNIVKSLFSGMGNVRVFMESLSKEHLAELYRSHDVFLFPSRSEGFGIPVLEALACGLLPIVTNYGGYLDFCNAKNALLVPHKGLIPRDDGMDTGEWAEIDCGALHEAIKQASNMDLDSGKQERAKSVATYTYDQTVLGMKNVFALC